MKKNIISYWDSYYNKKLNLKNQVLQDSFLNILVNQKIKN